MRPSIMDPDTAEDTAEWTPESPARPLTVKDHLEKALERAREYGEAWESACQHSRMLLTKAREDIIEECIEALRSMPPLASNNERNVELYAAAVDDCVDRIRGLSPSHIESGTKGGMGT